MTADHTPERLSAEERAELHQMNVSYEARTAVERILAARLADVEARHNDNSDDGASAGGQAHQDDPLGRGPGDL